MKKRNGTGKQKYFYFLVLWVCLCFALPSWAEKRVALVIGNSNYHYIGALENPKNDAQAMAQTLRTLGFEVIYKQDLKVNQLGPTLRELKSRLQAGDEVVVFYAGHGLEIDGENYFPAVDAKIEAKEEVKYVSLNLKDLLNLFEEAKTKVNVVFVDACRNNPLKRSMRSLGRGLASPVETSGTLIAYAAKHGTEANDGEDDKHSPYTRALIDALNQMPDARIEDILKRVKKVVKEKTKGGQEPWVYGSLDGDFYLVSPKVTVNINNNVNNNIKNINQINNNINNKIMDSKGASERVFWQSTEKENSIEAYQAYLKKYPEGEFVPLAQVKIDKLKKQRDNLAVENDPANLTANSYLMKGYQLLEAGLYSQALNNLNRAIDLNPSLAMAYNNRGWAYLELRQPDKALVDLNRAIQLDPELSFAYNNRGWAYLELREPQKALENLNIALQFDPKMATAYGNRGWAYLQLNQPEKALDDLNHAIRYNPNLGFAYNNRGWTYYQLKQYDKAVADYTRGLQFSPRSEKLYVNRALAYQALGRSQEAKADRAKAASLQ